MAMHLDTGVLISQTTQGDYMVRLETPDGTHEVLLPPEQFAKAVTGTYAQGRYLAPGPQAENKPGR